tara:strand:- start:653 stop:883 length:231 start_codon:yes stop_codon:yes gene_type:complete
MEIIDKVIKQFDLEVKFHSSHTNSSRWENHKINLLHNGYGRFTVEQKTINKPQFTIDYDDVNFEGYLISVIKLLQT